MKLAMTKRLWAAAACAAALMGAAAPSVANADVNWTVTGTFDDGGALSGSFDINVYGYLNGYDLKTTAGSSEGGFEYTPSNSYFSNGAFYVDAQPGYQSDLHLTFLGDLSVASANNPLVGGAGGPSYECVGSYSCYLPAYGTTRYIAEGFARASTDGQGGGSATPEPATWAMMLLGFGGVGAAMRMARRKGALAAAAI